MMNFNGRSLVPYIPPSEYDKVAREFLELFYPEALKTPMPIPIEEIARTMLGLDVQYTCLSEELDIYGMTIFTDGIVEVYDPNEKLYDAKFFKAKTVLIDPEAVKKRILGVVTIRLLTSVFIGISIDTTTKCRIFLYQNMLSIAGVVRLNLPN